jgi:hypothetical protein
MANEFVVRRGIKSLGGITFPQVTINSSYTVTDDDYMVDVTSGTFTVSLPTAVGRQGRLYVIKNNGGGAVTVDPYGSETIDGKPLVILGETNTIQLSSNGIEWVAIAYNISTVNSSTGVFEFTGMTIASPTTFTVAPVKAWIVDDSTNPLSPQLYYVDYSGGTHTAIYVTTSTSSYIYLNSGGTISQQSIPLTEQQRRQNIFLGKLGHANKTNIINAFSQPDFVLSPLSQLRDMFTPIPLINGGIYASPNGVNLSFNTSAGYLYGLGINFANDTLSPDAIYVTGTAPATFQYRTQTGGTASDVTLIDPTKYDVGGVITSLSGTKATNQRIFLVQNGKFRVQYGQTQYSNLSQAIAGIATETFTTFSNFRDNGILIGVLSVLSSATDLSDTSKAQFFYTSKFGETVGSAGGFSTTNLQQAYNNSIDPEIITNSTLGALTLQRGSASDSDNVFEVQDGAGVHRMWVSGSGRTTTTDLTITGVTSVSGLTRYLVVDNSGNTFYQTAGDMTLGSVQTNSGAKTFLNTTLLLRNVANTFNGSFTNTNTADRVYTLPNATGTIALTSDLSSYVPYTGASSNVNIGANSYLGTKIQLGSPTGNSFSSYAISVKTPTAEGLYIEGTASNAKILLQALGMTGGNGQVELTTGLNNNGFLRLGLTYLRESSGFLAVSATNFAPTSTLHVRGASASSGNAFLIQNSTPTAIFTVSNAGLATFNPAGASGDAIEITNGGYFKQANVRFRGSANSLLFYDVSYNAFLTLSPTQTLSSVPFVQSGYVMSNYGAGFGNAYFNIANTYTNILGGYLHGIEVKNTYNPSSSTGIFRDLYIAPIISSGVTDWRGIEVIGSGTSVSTLIKLNNGTTDLFVVKGDSKIGFFGATPVVKQTLGVATASSSYTATEQGMLQRVYDAIRTYGLGT